ncbi:MAG: septum formation initiator family protein, partial [Flavobacteriaceae bacterium]
MGLKELRNKKWFKLMTNMYVLVLTIFAIWMAFFDTNSLLIHMELGKEINKLEKQKEFLQGEIEKDKKILEKMSSEDELEKLAR